MNSLLDKFDHPLPFLIFMLLALWGMAAILTWGAKRMGWDGVASFFQHP